MVDVDYANGGIGGYHNLITAAKAGNAQGIAEGSWGLGDGDTPTIRRSAILGGGDDGNLT